MSTSTTVKEVSVAGQDARQTAQKSDQLTEFETNGVLAPEFESEVELGRRPIPVSGVYTRTSRGITHDPAAEGEIDPFGIDMLSTSEELRLDVDGFYPQMTVSGTIRIGRRQSIHWIARLTKTGAQSWEGPIWYKEGATQFFPFTAVQVSTRRIGILSPPRTEVIFLTDGPRSCKRTYKHSDPCFHSVKFEYDCAEGTTAETSIDTHDHPNRPVTLPNENLSIETVFGRAGFRVTKSGDRSIVPLAGAGPGSQWSDMEMHDAMQTYWSQFANAPQWAMWVFFAAQHEIGSSLGGIMFDDIGPNHRQGTAIFNDSFIASPPTGDPNEAAWVRRMKFWTAVHEMGHAFNLAHSWQKSLGDGWIPLADEPTARSFMNYPFKLAIGGQEKFFESFEFRFSDAELLFMRHAPEQFVQMGNADWFDNHGFRKELADSTSSLRLALRVNRPKPRFEYLEPVVVELKLTNLSETTQIVNGAALSDPSQLTIIIKKSGRPAQQFEAFAHYCQADEPRTLASGDSMYESLFVSAGRAGWQIAEPGKYTLQVACESNGQSLVSNPLAITVAGPDDFGEERFAQDYFSDDVARILTFGGSMVLDDGNKALEQIVERLPKRRAAIHARVALGTPLLMDYKRLRFVARQAADQITSAAQAGAAIEVEKAKVDKAHKMLNQALLDQPEEAAESLGHIVYRRQVEREARLLALQGAPGDAANCHKSLAETLKSRNVLLNVVRDVRRKGKSYLDEHEDEGFEEENVPNGRRRK